MRGWCCVGVHLPGAPGVALALLAGGEIQPRFWVTDLSAFWDGLTPPHPDVLYQAECSGFFQSCNS